MISRFVRALLVISAAAAIACQTDLGARHIPNLVPLNVTIFVLAMVAGWWMPAVGRWFVFLPASVFPALLLTVFGHFDPPLFSVWMAALLGLIIGMGGITRWSLPPAWRRPLAYWGLCVAVSWPLVAWRELDYTFSQILRESTSVTHIGISPAVEIIWIANVAATHLIGILWIDTLCGASPREDVAAEIRGLLVPALLGVLASAAVAIYQMFGHLTVFNETVFAAFKRASGAMVDGNALGMLTAIWIAGAVLAGWAGRGWFMRVVAALAVAALVMATWASGSQSAFFVVAVVLAGVVYGALRASRAVTWRYAVAFLAIAAVLGGAAIAVQRNSSTVVGPLQRLSGYFQYHRTGGRGVVAALWRRDGYGTVSTAVIRHFPWTGTGVGTFNSLLIDESLLLGGDVQAPDNAQNWFRHQLAEMGVIGSIGWIVWVVLFLPTLFRRLPPDAPPMAIYSLRAAIIGLGLASQIAMPTQNVVVLITFWTFVYWHGRLCGQLPSGPAATPAGGEWRWGVIVCAAAIYGAGVAWVGASSLRVPIRAAAVGWPYEHGVYDLESPPNAPAFRWTSQHAVTVAPVISGARYLELTFWVHHPDVVQRPVHVRIRVRGHYVFDQAVISGEPITRYVRIGTSDPGLIIESWVDRTWQPASNGAADDRTLGVAFADWKFTCCPPPGAIRVD